MSATVIDGKAIAAETRAQVAVEVARLARDHGVVPGLAVVLVGNNPASEVYVGSKKKMTVEAGMKSFDHHLSEQVSEAELLTLIAQWIGVLTASSVRRPIIGWSQLYPRRRCWPARRNPLRTCAAC